MAEPIPHKQQTLAGWGNYPRAECTVYRPEKSRELDQVFGESRSLLARGLGRAYGDAALNPEGLVLMERLDRFVTFDRKTGIVKAQAGLELAEMLNVTVPQGWIVPVIPGTKHVSLGGMAACDVHGKNHFQKGTIGSHVVQLSLRLPDGTRTLCSPQEETELFRATVGGMGMTGIIEEVTLQLQPITSLSLRTEMKRVAKLEEMLAAFEESKQSHEYRVGWIDHMGAADGALGRGVFEKAVHVSEAEGGKPLGAYHRSEEKLDIPVFGPDFLLNKYSMALYNRKRFAEYSDAWRSRIMDFEDFFHPLDNIGHWNRLYGKRGFLQYQCLLPEKGDMNAPLRELLRRIHEAGEFSFLAVLKHHGESGEGYLSFPQPGYSLALDFPNTAPVRKLQGALNEYVLKLGGRVYLAKDATLNAAHFEKMYGKGLTEWRRVVKRVDPQNRMHSLLAERLNMKGASA